MPTLLAANALGTRVELVIDEPETPALRAVGEEALDEIAHWHERLSKYLNHSFLSHLHREAPSRDIALDDDMFALLALCDRVHRDSAGAFDPTAGAPDPGGAGWSSSVSLDHDRRAVRFTRAGVRLDLGGVAKGFALDRAADRLREHRIASALLHAGTSGVVVLGDTPRAIGVRSARGVETVTIANESLCVSAPRGRVEAERTHIVDPITREPARRADTALAIGPTCAEADAWATALVVLGRRPDAAPAHLRTGVHDGQRWTTHDIHFSPASEAA